MTKWNENPITREIWENTPADMNHMEQHVLLRIARSTDYDTRISFIQMKTIAEQTHISYREVKYLIHSLELKGYLFVYTQRQRGKHHLFIIPNFDSKVNEFISPYTLRGVIYHYRDPALLQDQSAKGIVTMGKKSKAQ